MLAFFNQGEVCTCPSRALVHKDIYKPFMDLVIERTQKIVRGNPLDTETQVGAQASAEQYDKILSYMDIGRKEGADFLTGGNIANVGKDYEKGYYIEPTLMAGDNSMRVFQEEIFGPVVGVTTFTNEAEALAIANDTEFDLGAGVWSRGMNLAYRWREVLKRDESGPTATITTLPTPLLVVIKSQGLAERLTKSLFDTTSKPRIFW